jgi:hypothetical protein
MADELFDRVFEALRRTGLLLLTDAKLPSLTAIVAGAPVKGSWWGHAKGHAMHRVACGLGDHPDVLGLKLVNAKVTYVHRPLWPALMGAATAREAWQMSGLSAAAKSLLARVEKAGRTRAAGAAAKELEARLLALGGNEHTESGAHAKVLESWSRWAREAKPGAALAPEAGRRRLEEAVAALGGGALPWTTSSTAAGPRRRSSRA